MRLAPCLAFVLVATPASLACDYRCPSVAPWTVAGSATYLGNASAQSQVGAGGSFAATVALVAFDPRTANTLNDNNADSTDYCGSGSFAVALLGVCSLKADTGDVAYGSGDDSTGTLVSAGATIVPGQSCAIPAAGGTATLLLQQGSLTLTPSNLELTLAGTATGSLTGYVTLQFSGQVN